MSPDVRAGAVLPSSRFERTYLATPSVVGLVRRDSLHQMASWLVPDGVADDVALVVSEYVTNTVKYCPHKEFAFALSHLAEGILIEVWDGSKAIPEACQEPDEGGRGLHVIAALTDEDCGYRMTNGGKTVFGVVRFT